jgi:hypothetical protein
MSPLIFATGAAAFVIANMSATAPADDFRELPAGENACSRSCWTDQEWSNACMSNAVAANYLLAAIKTVLSEPLDALDRAGPMTCVCAKANLESTGVFSSVDIVRSTDVDAGLAIQRAILALRLSPVPKEAACILQPPINPIPMSFSSAHPRTIGTER